MDGQIVKKILIIEPSVIVSEGIKHLVDNLAGFDVCGIVNDLENGLEMKLGEYDMDLVIADPAVFESHVRPGGHDMIKNLTDVPVLAVLTSAMDARFVSGYDGVIYLTDKANEVEQKIMSAVNAGAPDSKGDGEELSSREKEILVCVAKGMLNKEIADHFSISIYTVITHRKNITRKTGIKTVAGLTVYALLNNLIDMNSME